MPPGPGRERPGAPAEHTEAHVGARPGRHRQPCPGAPALGGPPMSRYRCLSERSPPASAAHPSARRPGRRGRSAAAPDATAPPGSRRHRRAEQVQAARGRTGVEHDRVGPDVRYEVLQQAFRQLLRRAHAHERPRQPREPVRDMARGTVGASGPSGPSAGFGRGCRPGRPGRWRCRRGAGRGFGGGAGRGVRPGAGGSAAGGARGGGERLGGFRRTVGRGQRGQKAAQRDPALLQQRPPLLRARRSSLMRAASAEHPVRAITAPLARSRTADAAVSSHSRSSSACGPAAPSPGAARP